VFLGRCFHRIWVGEQFSSVSPAEFLTFFFFFFFFFFYVLDFFSLELDLLTLAGSSKACASPRGSPTSSSPAASSHGRVGSSRAACGLHAAGRSLPSCHGLSFRVRWVVLWWFQGLPVVFCCKRGPWWRCMAYMRRC
jgi:hypothetical protein